MVCAVVGENFWDSFSCGLSQCFVKEVILRMILYGLKQLVGMSLIMEVGVSLDRSFNYPWILGRSG